MRRILVSMAMACTVVPLMASMAGAKGWELEHSTVTIRGPGLSSPITLRHEAAGIFMLRSGGGQLKWDVPNIAGTLSPNADLGPWYTAVVHLRCGAGVHSMYRQLLYPRAPQGLQVYTPQGAKGCFPHQFSPGYWPASRELLALLVKRGLPVTSTDTDTTSANASPVAAVAKDPNDGGSSGTGRALVGSLLAVGLLGGGSALVLRRRRRAEGGGSA
jgi:hypothetical protein